MVSLIATVLKRPERPEEWAALSSLRIGTIWPTSAEREHVAAGTRAQIVRTQKHTPEDRIAVEWATAKLSKIEAKNHRALADLLGLSEDHLGRIAKGALVPARPLLALFHVLSVRPELKQALEAFWSDYEAAIQVPPPALEAPTVSDG